MLPKSLYRNLTFAAFVSVLIIGYGTSVWADETEGTAEEAKEWDIRWKDTLLLDSPDGHWKLKFGGRFQLDYATAEADPPFDALTENDGSDVRRGRLVFSGKAYKRLEFKFDYDFVPEDFADAYLGLKSDWGTVRIGHHKDLFSLEEQASSNHLTYIERALPTQAFSPGRNTGLSARGALGDRFDWGFGFFYDTSGFGQSLDDKDRLLSSRLVYRPVFEDGGRRLVHLGLSMVRREHESTVRFRARPEVRAASSFLDTGTFVADRTDTINLELAQQNGPFHWEAEYMRSDVDTPSGSSPSFDGLYASAGYFFTGEHRTYARPNGRFRRVRPTQSVVDNGPGAWQVALRYSTIDLNDGALRGGTQDNWTLALNWYPTAATRLMINWVHADIESAVRGRGEADFIVVRGQIEF